MAAGTTIRTLAVAAAIGVGLGGVVYALLRSDLLVAPAGGPGQRLRWQDPPGMAIDPALVRYREAAHWPLPLRQPRALAVLPDGRAAAGGDRQVVLLDPNGHPAGRFAVGGPVRCLAAGPEGRLYVGLTDRVEVYRPDGQRQAAWEPIPQARLTSLAADATGVYVADYGNRAVYRYGPDGQRLGVLTSADPVGGRLGLVVPSPFLDVAVYPGGTVRVVNPGRHRIEAYTPHGEPADAPWGEPSMADVEGFVGCCNPAHLAVGPDGTLFTSEKGIPRVKAYRPDGTFDGVVAPPSAFAEHAVGLDLAVDARGRVLVLDPDRRAVRVFVPRPDNTADATRGRP